MKIVIRYTLLFFLSFSFNLFAQDNQTSNNQGFIIDDGDTILISEIPNIDVISFKDDKERAKYFILKRKVLKVYPYALYTKRKLDKIEKNLDGIKTRKKKKKYVREVTRFLKEELGEELKKLTRTEGNILVKLIYRETRISTYRLVQKYRGRANAFVWQTVAKFYDNDLKQEYDPENNREDMLIEYILLQSNIKGLKN